MGDDGRARSLDESASGREDRWNKVGVTRVHEHDHGKISNQGGGMHGTSGERLSAGLRQLTEEVSLPRRQYATTKAAVVFVWERTLGEEG
jgi:hypothetical protein